MDCGNGLYVGPRLSPEEEARLFSRLLPEDVEEAREVIESDYPEILYDPSVHPVEIDDSGRLRWCPDNTRNTAAELEALKNSNRHALKDLGYTLSRYFETPVVRKWVRLVQAWMPVVAKMECRTRGQEKRLREKQEALAKELKLF